VVRRARKLPIAKVGRPDLTIGDKDWQRIENAFGKSLSDSVRAAIVEATREFLLWDAFERTAEPLAKSQKRIEEIREGAAEFQHVLLSVHSEAALYAQLLVSKHFKDPRLSNEPDRFYPWFHSLDSCFYSLSNVLNSLQLSCDLALRELEPPVSTKGVLGDFGAPPSFMEGEAWGQWIRQLTVIVKNAKLPWRVRKDADKSDRQSPFTLLVRELQECAREWVPQCKLPYAESALPTAIGKARRKSLRLSSAIRSAKSGSKTPCAELE
jgi:hypothetical protein